MRMRCYVQLVLFLQCLGGSGFPLFDVASKADGALQMAMDEINTSLSQRYLYRVFKASVTKVIPLGLNTYDLILAFGIRETDCVKGSGLDPQGCAYRRGFFVPDSGCSIRVRVTDSSTTIQSLKCSQTQSSSSESSEEWQPGYRNPNPARRPVAGTAAPRIDVAPRLGLGRHNDNTQIRGDQFTSYLE
ncbi:secreted phosphoprotein 24 [Electrophorus electricus]|uniref:Secreted phosphoprotein 24 n=1 Tax=Electrophorus electricus TaxID=8005 RepID=A0A4W4EYN4_ELEEL|nr:secreted phosphoprotein 24 [Electrophorus electricus]